MTSRATSAAILLAATLALSGCKPDAALKKSEVIDRGTLPGNSTIPSVDAGILTGTVHFTGKAPERVRIDMTMDPACSVSAAENDAEQLVVNDGGLANVFITIKSGAAPSYATAGTPPVILDQKGCRYIPHVIAVQQGGSVEFRNSDPTMHNIHTMPTVVGNTAIDVSQGPMGQPQIRQFKQPETMLPVRCNNHPWMNAFINVANTPYFAVSAADGTFTISGLPPGNYTIAAVHEKLGEQDLQISIPPKGTAKADFTYSNK